MLRLMHKSKIHRAAVTRVDLNYEGSITVDSLLMKQADILPNEKVHVLNLDNGSRCETYCIEGKPGSGIICINGAAAHHSKTGDKIIIIAYGLMDAKEAVSIKPKVIYVDEKNRIRKIK
ncbi:MAG: aspartate 1-decarboxylase [Candidatus Omnitrophota bacterium]|nr:aspartate 1-decarboxylase [Candidatus Omnitrophota bacterium]